jgi:acyl dehydratase
VQAGEIVLPDDLSRFIGQTVETSVFDVEKEPIRRFADAVGDTNPLYWDEEYARNSRYGSIIAPPGFLSSLWFAGRSSKWGKGRPSETLGPPEVMAAIERAGFRRILDTGMDYEFVAVVKAGDTISSVSTVKDIMERGAEQTRTIFLVVDTVYSRGEGKVVARSRSMTVHQ